MIGRTNAGGGGGGQTWSIRGWCNTVGLSYGLLDDITEADMRTLMTKYASVAYFREWYATEPSMIDQFVANAYAMKWIGLRDYICDKLMAVSDFKTKALASANWEYILKDHVPIMTSDTAPYGEAYADVTYGTNYSAFNAFSADRSKVWADSSNSTLGHFIYYKFVNPICVKKFLIEQYVATGGSERLSSVNLEASNDGTNWTSIASNINVHGRTDYTYLIDVNNDNYYLYYRIVIAGKLVADCILMRTLQFYGRSLNVSVPKMTSNTAPYGEIQTGTYVVTDAWMAFDKDKTTGVSLISRDTIGWLGYKFANPVVVRFCSVLWGWDNGTHWVEGSNDGNSWTTVLERSTSTAYTESFEIPNNVAYKYWRLRYSRSDSGMSQIRELDFFGVDYSERTDRTYLYDHGLAFGTFLTHVTGDSTVTLGSNAISMNRAEQQDCQASIQCDFTNKSLLMAISGDHKLMVPDGSSLEAPSLCVCSASTFSAGSSLARHVLKDTYFTEHLDVSAITGQQYALLLCQSGRPQLLWDVLELWLE